jgi:hypothetical protein
MGAEVVGADLGGLGILLEVSGFGWRSGVFSGL